MRVTNYPQGGCPPTLCQSPPIPKMVTNNQQDSQHPPQDGHLVSPGYSTSIHMMVIHPIPMIVAHQQKDDHHHIRDSHLPSPDLDFDSAQLLCFSIWYNKVDIKWFYWVMIV